MDPFCARKRSSSGRWLPLLYGPLLAVAVLDRLPLVSPWGSVSAYRALSLPLLGGVAFCLFGQRRIRMFDAGWVWHLLLGLLLVMGGATFFAQDLGVAFVHLARLGEYAFWATLLALAWSTAWSREHEPVLFGFLGAAAGLASLSILTDFLGWTTFYRWYQSEAPWVRQLGLLGEANYAGARLAVLFPFVWYGLSRCARQRRWGGVGLWLVVAFTAALALFLTGSRMGGLLALLGLLVYGWQERRSVLNLRVLARAFLLALLLTLLSLSLVERASLERAFQYLGHRYALLVTFIQSGQERYRGVRETSLRERLAMLEASVRMFQDHPWTGVGLANFPLLVGEYDPEAAGLYSHNTYASVLAETGIGGMVVFVLLCLSIWRALYRRVALGEEGAFYPLLSYGLLVVGLAFLHDLDNKLFWTLFLPWALGGRPASR